MRNLFFLFLFLTSCTNAIPKVIWLRSPDGPKLDKTKYSESSDFIISGSTLQSNEEATFLLRSNINSSWKNVKNILDMNYQNDLDISDKNFIFKIDKSKFTFEGSTTLFVKIIFSSGMETNESVIKLAPDELIAIIADAHTPENDSNLTLLNLNVFGNNISSFSYKFGDSSIDCLNSAGYTEQSTLNLILDLSLMSDGLKKLCLIGKSAGGETQNVLFPTEKIWRLDTAPPLFSILETIPLVNNLVSIPLTIQSLDPQDPVVKYRYAFSKNNSDCLDDFSYSTSQSISHPLSLSLDSDKLNSQLFFCLIVSDKAGNWTNVNYHYSLSWTNSSHGPTMPSVSSTGINPTKLQSPEFTIASTTGVVSSSYKIVNNNAQVDFVSWTSFSLSSSLQVALPSSVENTNYSLWFKLIDSSGNKTEGSVATWTHDIIAPVLNVYQAAESKSLQKSPTFYLGATDNYALRSIKVYILNAEKNIIYGPEIVSANSFYINSMQYIKNSGYTFRLEATDWSSNLSVVDLDFTSANCADSNPNDENYKGTICEEVSSNQILGWKMQGGIIMAKESETKFIVVESPLNMTSSSTGPLSWGTLDSGYYISGTGFSGEKDPMQKSYLNSPVNQQCRTMTKNTFSDWFLPTLTQLSKVYCNTTNTTPFSVFPSYDPSCSNSRIVSVGNFGNINYWTNSEYSATRAISLNMSTGAENVENKSTSLSYICVRSFSR